MKIPMNKPKMTKKEAFENIGRREIMKYNSSIKAKDVFKHGATEGCIG